MRLTYTKELTVNNSDKPGGLGLCSVLFLIFLILKLTRVITWSWWIVTLPMWGPVALFVLLTAAASIAAAVVSSFGNSGRE
jgi:hypothetical protein